MKFFIARTQMRISYMWNFDFNDTVIKSKLQIWPISETNIYLKQIGKN